MATRTTPGEGDYNLSHPINSFVDVARRVVLQPVGFFAGLPRDRNFVSPLLFALICVEVSAFLGVLLGELFWFLRWGYDTIASIPIPKTFGSPPSSSRLLL